jgi:TRAP-type C4-dicarboxylate transport system permease small subunit
LRPDLVLESRRQKLFYGLFLPVGVMANFALGLVLLTGLNPASWSEWLQIGSGALCCVIAGWLAAAAWSNFYWNRNISRQVAKWRRIADAFFAWVEEAPLPAESLHTLMSSLEEAVPSSETR